MNEHPPRLALERFLLDELAGTVTEPWREHVLGCAQCTEAITQMRSEDAAYRSSDRMREIRTRLAQEARPEPSAPRRSRWARRSVVLAVGSAAGIVVALILERPPADQLAIKGGFGTLYVDREHEGRVTAATGEPLAIGDGLQLRWSSAADGTIAVIGVERGGQRTVLYPSTPARSAPIARGKTVDLGGRIVVDASIDGARICVLYARSIFDLDASTTEECLAGGPRVAARLDLSVQAPSGGAP
ncbi:MAG: hypothetical protein IT384_03920 [Deltaproteobacteria bacterium]|nr:hypothetical protein [Deltaproteobacteria bacterium]